jgi:hypothetical protein
MTGERTAITEKTTVFLRESSALKTSSACDRLFGELGGHHWTDGDVNETRNGAGQS